MGICYHSDVKAIPISMCLYLTWLFLRLNILTMLIQPLTMPTTKFLLNFGWFSSLPNNIPCRHGWYCLWWSEFHPNEAISLPKSKEIEIDFPLTHKKSKTRGKNSSLKPHNTCSSHLYHSSIPDCTDEKFLLEFFVLSLIDDVVCGRLPSTCSFSNLGTLTV